MTDPEMMEGMMEGMKKQLMNMVPQMIIMGWINFFFQGFVVSKSFGLHQQKGRKKYLTIPF